ncbi:MAG: hypothetical protein ACYC26_00565 [Phycisphaerales bacterium]
MRLWKRPKLSDEAFVERVRKWQRRRRWYCLSLIAVGLLLIGMSYWGYGKIIPVKEMVAEIASDPGATDDTIAAANQASFLLGAFYGFAVYGLEMMGIWAMLLGITSGFVTTRRDRLLLQCWDRLHVMGAGTDEKTRNDDR